MRKADDLEGLVSADLRTTRMRVALRNPLIQDQADLLGMWKIFNVTKIGVPLVNIRGPGFSPAPAPDPQLRILTTNLLRIDNFNLSFSRQFTLEAWFTSGVALQTAWTSVLAGCSEWTLRRIRRTGGLPTTTSGLILP
jgi:hypothetical protein